MNGICVIYDKDEKYAKRLMNVMSEKKTVPYGIQIFTKEQELISYLDHHKPDLMMVSEDCYSYEVSHRKDGKTVILMDNEDEVSACTKKYDQNTVGVYKYQSSENLLKEVINVGNCQSHRNIEEIETIGIFTPIEMLKRISFSLNLAKVLSIQCKTLYISLQEFSGLDEILPAKANMTLSDVIYYYRQNCGHIDQKMSGAICSIGSVDYIAPVQCAEDIAYIEPEELMKLVQKIAADAGYDKVVLDLSDAVRQQWKLLLNCDKVFMPIQNDYLSQRKVQEFEIYFLSQQLEGVLKKIEKIVLPDENCDIDCDFWEKNEYSVMYRYTEKLVTQ